MIASTSTVEHHPRLHPNRRSIALTTGERTATLKSDTRITRRMFAIDASAQAMATAPATNRIVWIEIETLISDREAAPVRNGAVRFTARGGSAPASAEPAPQEATRPGP
jgi:hypothetical protein